MIAMGERADAEISPAPKPPAMVEYVCRGCKGFLFASDATVGRVQGVKCRDRRCGLVQTVYLGGRRTAEQVAEARLRESA